MKRLAAWPFRWGMGHVVRRLGRRTVIDTFVIFDATRNGLEPGAVDSLGKAFSLIQRVAPGRYARLQRDMPTITIAEDERIEYALVMQSGFLSRSLIVSRPSVTVAAVLIGLGARARVSNRRGGWTLDVVAKQRLVRVDAVEQMRFVAKLDARRYSNTRSYVEYLARIIAAE